MKIALGMKIQRGPFGGGNQFGGAISEYLAKHGHHVFFDLSQPDLDIILMTDPRPWLKSVSFGAAEVIKYVRCVNPSVLLIHRVNECDERKGSKTLNRQLASANSIMDHTVYVGSWLIDLFRHQNLTFTPSYSVIKNGADQRVFQYKKRILTPSKKIRLVTHHWSANWNKGWDVYMYLDSVMESPTYQKKIELHYIGNVPKWCRPKNIILHQPMTGRFLSQLLSSCDIYVTASMNEPGANHPVEGALCGLPLLYRDSGSLPEYCNGYGEIFSGANDVLPALETLIDKYTHYVNRLATYSQTSERMCQEYTQLLQNMLAQRDQFLQTRKKEAFNLIGELRMKVGVGWYRLLSKLERV